MAPSTLRCVAAALMTVAALGRDVGGGGLVSLSDSKANPENTEEVAFFEAAPTDAALQLMRRLQEEGERGGAAERGEEPAAEGEGGEPAERGEEPAAEGEGGEPTEGGEEGEEGGEAAEGGEEPEVEGEGEEGEEGEGGEEGEEGEEEGEEEEEEEEEFGDVDVACAVMLLFSITFVVLIIIFVNYADDDVRRYAWIVISNTLSIFLAVLFFQGNKTAILKLMDTLGVDESWAIYVDLVHASAYMAALYFTIGHNAGVWSNTTTADLEKEGWTVADALRCTYGKELEPDEVKSVRAEQRAANTNLSEHEREEARHAKNSNMRDPIDGLEVPVKKRLVEYERRQRLNQCYAMLFAHCSGFAVIAAGSNLQQSKAFKWSWYTAIVPIFVIMLFLNIMFRGMSSNLRKLKKEAADAGRKGLRAKMFAEFLFEAQTDILALMISFLLVQAVRMALTGILPNEEGIEEPEEGPEFVPTVMLFVKLLIIGVLFLVASLVLLRSKEAILSRVAPKPAESEHAKKKPEGEEGESEEEEEEEDDSIPGQLVGAFVAAFAMCFAWCTLFAVRWAWDVYLPLGMHVFSMPARVVMACGVSVIGFVAVVFLDIIADKYAHSGADSGGVASLVNNIVAAVSLLVGFAWEHSFDGAVEAVAELNKAHPSLTKFILGLVLVGGLIGPWRRYILQRSIQLSEFAKARRNSKKKLEKKQAALSGRSSAAGEDSCRPLMAKGP